MATGGRVAFNGPNECDIVNCCDSRIGWIELTTAIDPPSHGIRGPETGIWPDPLTAFRFQRGLLFGHHCSVTIAAGCDGHWHLHVWTEFTLHHPTNPRSVHKSRRVRVPRANHILHEDAFNLSSECLNMIVSRKLSRGEIGESGIVVRSAACDLFVE